MEFNTSLFIYINFCIRKIHTYLDYLDITFLKERYIYILSYIIFKNIIFKKKTSIFKILLMETLRKIQGQYKYIKIISDWFYNIFISIILAIDENVFLI